VKWLTRQSTGRLIATRPGFEHNSAGYLFNCCGPFPAGSHNLRRQFGLQLGQQMVAQLTDDSTIRGNRGVLKASKPNLLLFVPLFVSIWVSSSDTKTGSTSLPNPDRFERWPGRLFGQRASRLCYLSPPASVVV